jgi:hypothetical protein
MRRRSGISFRPRRSFGSGDSRVLLRAGALITRQETSRSRAFLREFSRERNREHHSMSTRPALKVGRTSAGYRIRVEGRGTCREMPALLGLFVVQVLDRTDRSLVIDLTVCEELDAKFAATLVDLHGHYGHGEPPRFAITAPAAADLPGCSPFPVCLAASFTDSPEIDTPELALPPMKAGTRDLEQHLKRWHRRLAFLESRKPESPNALAASAGLALLHS